MAAETETGALSFNDTGLDVNTNYRYYLVVKSANGDVVTLVNNSQLLVMERS